MDSVIIWIIGLYFAVVANTVGCGDCESYRPRHEVVYSPLTFRFFGSLHLHYNMLFHLENVSPKITAIYVTTEAGDAPKTKNRWYWDQGDYRLCGDLLLFHTKFMVHLELYSADGLCATKLVSEGRRKEISLGPNGFDDTTYKHDYGCLKFLSTACGVVVDLKNDCIETRMESNEERGETSAASKPKQTTTDTTRHTMTTFKPTVKYSTSIQTTTITPKRQTTKPTQKFTTTTETTSVTPKPTQYIPNTSMTPQRKISDIQNVMRSISQTTRNTSIAPKPAISYITKVTQNISDISKSIVTTEWFSVSNNTNTLQNISITPNPKRETSDTSKSSNNTFDTFNKNKTSETNVTLDISDTTNATRYASGISEAADVGINVQQMTDAMTITVILAVSVMVLILLVIAIKICCWMKRSPSHAPPSPIIDQQSPFYLNLLFRQECDQEIELTEQHHYEEINSL